LSSAVFLSQMGVGEVLEGGALASELGEGQAPSRGVQRSGRGSILLRVHCVCKPGVEAGGLGVGGGTGARIAGRKGKRLGVGQHVGSRGV